MNIESNRTHKNVDPDEAVFRDIESQRRLEVDRLYQAPTTGMSNLSILALDATQQIAELDKDRLDTLEGKRVAIEEAHELLTHIPSEPKQTFIEVEKNAVDFAFKKRADLQDETEKHSGLRLAAMRVFTWLSRGETDTTNLQKFDWLNVVSKELSLDEAKEYSKAAMNEFPLKEKLAMGLQKLTHSIREKWNKQTPNTRTGWAVGLGSTIGWTASTLMHQANPALAKSSLYALAGMKFAEYARAALQEKVQTSKTSRLAAEIATNRSFNNAFNKTVLAFEKISRSAFVAGIITGMAAHQAVEDVFGYDITLDPSQIGDIIPDINWPHSDYEGDLTYTPPDVQNDIQQPLEATDTSTTTKATEIPSTETDSASTLGNTTLQSLDSNEVLMAADSEPNTLVTESPEIENPIDTPTIPDITIQSIKGFNSDSYRSFVEGIISTHNAEDLNTNPLDLTNIDPASEAEPIQAVDNLPSDSSDLMEPLREESQSEEVEGQNELVSEEETEIKKDKLKKLSYTENAELDLKIDPYGEYTTEFLKLNEKYFTSPDQPKIVVDAYERIMVEVNSDLDLTWRKVMNEAVTNPEYLKLSKDFTTVLSSIGSDDRLKYLVPAK